MGKAHGKRLADEFFVGYGFNSGCHFYLWVAAALLWSQSKTVVSTKVVITGENRGDPEMKAAGLFLTPGSASCNRSLSIIQRPTFDL